MKSTAAPLWILLAAAALGPLGCSKAEDEGPPVPVQAAAPPPAAPKPVAEAPKVEVSTPVAPKPPTPDDYYTASKIRDPFVVPGSGGGGAAVAATVEVSTDSFDIHALNLKGILETPKGPIALLVDSTNNASYILKSGKVLGAKDKPVPGVSGQIRGRTVRLVTKEKDVQDLQLGEEEDQ